MDPKKKKIYIAIIVTCFVLSAGILIWTQLGSQEPSLGPAELAGDPVVGLPVNEASGDVSSGFKPLAGFPTTETFRSEVLKSSEYQDLKPYNRLDVTGQLGRTDPFNRY